MSIQRESASGPITDARTFVVLLLATAVALGPCVASARTQPGVDDDDITSAIDGELWVDPVVDANPIDVSTTDGIVTLTGNAGNLLVKERTAAIAASTVGVRGVVNRLAVAPAVERSDAELERAIRSALLEDSATESYEIEVSASLGQVTLRGTTQSWQEKQIVESVVKGVRGVRGVANEIEIRYDRDRSDPEVESEVEARLANDVLVDDFLIVVEVTDGVVRLDGTVGSLAEKDRAISDAWVTGTASVDGSGLEIEWWARDSLRRKVSYVDRSDAAVEQAVRDAFLYDPRVAAFRPDVSVEEGSVTLTGVVDSLAAKRAAEQDARNVVGVWRVRNHLKVRPAVLLSDADLEAAVKDAFAEDPVLERWSIGVEASQGLVVLSGKVKTSFEKMRAETVAEGVPGVTEVSNNVDFEHRWRWKPDREIRADIRDQLWWSPFVDADEVNVAVDDGIATLSGTVDTWSEWDAATDNAFEGGAKDVRNRLSVTYPFAGPRPVFDAPTYRYGD